MLVIFFISKQMLLPISRNFLATFLIVNKIIFSRFRLDLIVERFKNDLEEVLTYDDMKRELLSPNTLVELKDCSLKNYENRCLQYHVLNLVKIKEMFKFVEINFIKANLLIPIV